MIKLGVLAWSHMFSYGEDNQIDFSKDSITQLLGKNGHGKSSIALILEEVLFNTNSKGIKKGDILNRYSKAKAYQAELTFEKDGYSYKIQVRRGSTQTVKLLRDDTDISSHTPTETYKQIKAIIGMDQKAFAQIVYQSNANSLGFLTSPDTARKKFLIDLFDLGRYLEIGDTIKEVLSTTNKELAKVEGRVAQAKDTISRYAKLDLNTKPTLEVPEPPNHLQEEKATLQNLLDNLEDTNNKIVENNKLVKSLDSIKLVEPKQPKVAQEQLLELTAKQATIDANIKRAKTTLTKLNGINSACCPTCLQPVDADLKASMHKEAEDCINSLSSELSGVLAELDTYTKNKNAWATYDKAVVEKDRIASRIRTDLGHEIQDAGELVAKINTLNREIQTINDNLKAIIKQNNTIVAENSRLATIRGELELAQAKMQELESSGIALQQQAGLLNILVKTFSTTGLVAYKLENLVKDLEEASNGFLIDLSDGRFQLGFEISGSDKLNVVITDNGKDIDFLALSGGERARVNLAALFGIRKLMQALSNSQINLLILDETVEALDAEGKEKLVEVLLEQENLNTVLVSHGFTHPLLSKVHVTKENNISRIEK